MYRHILCALDGSAHGDLCAEWGVALARRLGSRLTGVHVTNSDLHSAAFRSLEVTLTGYDDAGLQRQREIHAGLIREGLRRIGASYLGPLEERAGRAGVLCDTKVLEGRHYEALAEEIESGSYDLAVLGHLGLGAAEESLAGGVVERVARRVRKDLLVVRPNGGPGIGGILVGVDGSEGSVAALRRSIALAREFGSHLETAHVFDPEFHSRIFGVLERVLSAEVKGFFGFEKQRTLHREVIDRGLEKVGRRYLQDAKKLGAEGGVEVATSLLRGKPFAELLKHTREGRPWLLVVGRHGRHMAPSADIGNTAENLLRRAPSSVLVVDGAGVPAAPGAPRTA